MNTLMLERRGFLGLVGASAAVSAPLQGVAQASPPPDIGRKFYPDGRVMRFDGNTIICHLDQQGPNAAMFEAMLDVYRDAPRHAFMRKVTLLPPSSYHMTIFGAANDKDRKLPLWPSDLPPDMSMQACDEALGSRLRAVRFGIDRPFRMKVDVREPKADERPLTIRLLPADNAEERRLRDLRNQFSDILKIRAPRHDEYSFHITMGYLIRWLNSAEQAAFRQTLKVWRETVASACPVIELGVPEYCTIKDMFHFSRQFNLR
jgi:hypothetical protein